MLKMQLNMTVPADLDNEDRALGGEEEVFDLGEGERKVSRGGLRKALRDVVRDEDGLSEDEEEGSGPSETCTISTASACPSGMPNGA